MLVLHPKSPVLLTEVNEHSQAKISVFDPETKQLVHYGWVDLKGYSGWTISEYDWSRVTK